jgi:hypothetical protein
MRPSMLRKSIHRHNLQSCTDLRKEVSVLHPLKRDHKWRVLIPRYITNKIGDCLLLNTLSFLHSHNDQIKAIAPTLICFLNLWSILLSQFPKILAILHGRYKVEATWMTDHIERAKQHWKKRCLIVSSWGQKTHFLQPCQFRFASLSLVKMTPLRRYHPNTFIHSGIFNFQSLLLLTFSNGRSGWISALYMEATENLPFL